MDDRIRTEFSHLNGLVPPNALWDEIDAGFMLFATAVGVRFNGKEQDEAKRGPKSILKLPDLEQAKSAFLNSLIRHSSPRDTRYAPAVAK